MRTALPFLLAVAVIAATVTSTLAISSKACRRKASKASEKYIDCVLKAEEKNAKPKKVKKCGSRFRKKYSSIFDLEGCTKKVIPKFGDVQFEIDVNCLTAGYDGNYCATVAEAAIEGTSGSTDAIACTEEALVCPNGDDFAVRDFLRQCEFTPCCCDPAKEPGKFGNPIGREGYVCCPNGEWTSNNLGDGKTYFCDSEDPSIGTTGPFGRRCQTSGPSSSLPPIEQEKCDPEEKPGANGNPDCGPGGFTCCPNGEWTCGVIDGITASISCEEDDPPFPPVEEEDDGGNSGVGSGDNCDPMLEPGKFDNPICTDLYKCCPNGEWSCGIGDGTIPCEEEEGGGSSGSGASSGSSGAGSGEEDDGE